MNAARKLLGADVRVAMAAGVIGGVLMPFLHSVWYAAVAAMVAWVIGAICEKRDPRFFDFFPLRFQLKDRYEVGK